LSERRRVSARLRHLPSGLTATAVLLVLGVPLGALLRGGPGAAGAAAGVALVATSYVIGSVVIAWADSVDPKLVLPAGLMTYALKFTLIGVVMAAIAASHWAGLRPMGVAVLATALAWVVAQSWWTWHARIAYVDL
jgi:ATP synthase protein I